LVSRIYLLELFTGKILDDYAVIGSAAVIGAATLAQGAEHAKAPVQNAVNLFPDLNVVKQSKGPGPSSPPHIGPMRIT